jgi:hypothetical protein
MARGPKPPSAPQPGGDVPAPQSSRAEIDAFLGALRDLPVPRRMGEGPAGRLIFAMDATMSRKPTWDMALALQAEMFQAVREIGGLDVQLVFFRGFDECRASRWVSDASGLSRLMASVDCLAGRTQIRKVLAHAIRETNKAKVNALVYVGDSMEEEIDRLSELAGELGLLRLPAFLFQEGYNPGVAQSFGEIARLTGGATCRFGPGSAAELRELLRAVAVYAAGGRAALEHYAKGRAAPGFLLEQLSKPAGGA